MSLLDWTVTVISTLGSILAVWAAGMDDHATIVWLSIGGWVSVLVITLIGGRLFLQKTGSLIEQLDDLEVRWRRERNDAEQSRKIAETLEAEVHRLTRLVSYMLEGVRIISRQLADVGTQPAWTPPADIEKYIENLTRNTSPDSLFSLAVEIGDLYSQEELTLLMARLGLDPESITGMSKQARALNLIMRMQRTSRMDDLLDALRMDRPHGRWDGQLDSQ